MIVLVVLAVVAIVGDLVLAMLARGVLLLGLLNRGLLLAVSAKDTLSSKLIDRLARLLAREPLGCGAIGAYRVDTVVSDTEETERSCKCFDEGRGGKVEEAIETCSIIGGSVTMGDFVGISKASERVRELV